jgi:hypothetical protein
MKQQLRRAVGDIVTDRRDNPAACRLIDLWNRRLDVDVVMYRCTTRPSQPPCAPAGLQLTFRSPACGLIGDADVRAFDRHPHASISSLIPALTCPRYMPNGPFVKLLRLS